MNDSPSRSKFNTSIQFVVATSDPSGNETTEFISGLLCHARTLLEMDIAFVSEFTQGRRMFLSVDATTECSGAIRVGQSHPLEETYCQRVVDGRLPLAIPDTQCLPEAAELSVTRALNIRAYLAAPITLSSGEVIGTLCCISHRPRTTLGNLQIDALRTIANLISVELRKNRLA